MKQKGFTLIELLVVITIIAVLSAVGLVSYMNAGTRSRDARRIEDLKEIQKGLEQYYAKNSGYQPKNFLGSGCAAFADKDIFPQGKPVPPIGGDSAYVAECTQDGYYAYITVEDIKNANAAFSDPVCNFTAAADAKKVYCVVNLQ